ncbi:MAG: glycosyltransferase [Clostridia bacterium]|nr:glycosyltransferase [Clostridia bacterium]
MKILFFNTNIGYGGASKIMASIANHMSEENQVDYLTYRNSDVLQPLSDRVNHIHNTLYTNSNKFIEIIGQLKALRKFIKKGRYDLCVSFLNPASYMLILATRGLNTKVLLSERGDPNEMINSKSLFDRIVFKLVQKAEGYVFQTEQALKCYSKRAQKKSVVIPNPMPDKSIPEPYQEERNKVIVTASRMDLYQKRQDVLINAFAKIANDHPDYILRLYGDGPDMDKIRQIAEDTGYGDRIEFMGVSKNVLEDIKESALFVLSSDFEGIPNALLEAMACGLPCISTDCSPGGARVIIDNGENGIITPCGDADALSEAMEKLIEDNKLSQKFSANAVKVTEIFSKDIVFSKWKSFMEDMIK